MPIKGVSEVIRLPRLGKIRLGIKLETGDGIPYPSPTDYFVCPDEVKKVFGEKPRELRIMFPTEDESQWASQYLRCYSASRGLICRGDGETAMARVDIGSGEIASRESAETKLREIACNTARCANHQKGQCRRVMNLQFILPDCPGFGVYQLDTTSFFSIVNVNSSLELIRGACSRLSMIPLSLKLVEQEVQPEGRKKTVRVLTLSAPHSLAEIQKYARMPPGEALLLPPPDAEAPEDLFPHEMMEQSETEDIPCVDEGILDAWEMVKERLKKLNITQSTLAKWFRARYGIEVKLPDFDRVFPPDTVTWRMLSSLYDCLGSYRDRQQKPR